MTDKQDEPKTKKQDDPGAENGEEKTSTQAQADSKKQFAKAADQNQFAMPKIDFSTFIISLNSSALVQLGVLEDPSTGRKEKNIILAKQTIDILGMLEEKTRNNLNEEEENILKNILFDLRMLFVRESRQ